MYASRLLVCTLFVALAACPGDEPSTTAPPPSDGTPTTNACGNDQLNGLESCDGTLFRSGSLCADYGLGAGDVVCSSTCTLDFSGCAQTDLCAANGWNGDGNVCDDCEAMGGSTPDSDCATLCIADGGSVCADRYNDITGQWTCQAVLGSTDPDCGACGNSTIEGNEKCDGTAFPLDAAACTDFGFVDGTLGCTDQCLPDFARCLDEKCGNFLVEGSEPCDGTNLAGKSCESQGYYGGELQCTSSCTLDTRACVSPGTADWSRLITAVCGSYVRCAGEFGTMVESQASCETHLLADLTCSGTPPGTQSDVDACATWFTTAPCADNPLIGEGVALFDLPASCLRVIFGVELQAAGQQCELLCESGYVCTPSVGANACNVCRALANPGERCGIVGDGLVWCDPRVGYCDETTGRCQPLKAAGVPCGDEDECQSRFCRGGQCLERILAGQACDRDTDVCQGARRCIGGVCTDRQLATEGPCLNKDDCIEEADCVDQVCTKLLACVPRAIGDPCDEDQDCIAGAYCDPGPGSGECAAITPLGQACTSFNECGPNGYCAFPASLCTAAVGPGGACGAGQRCVEGTFCNFDTRQCTAPAANGAECSRDRDCLSDHCDDTINRCADEPACVMP